MLILGRLIMSTPVVLPYLSRGRLVPLMMLSSGRLVSFVVVLRWLIVLPIGLLVVLGRRIAVVVILSGLHFHLLVSTTHCFNNKTSNLS